MKAIYLYDGTILLGPCAPEVSLHPDGTARLRATVCEHSCKHSFKRSPRQLASAKRLHPVSSPGPWYPFGDLSAKVQPGDLADDEIAVHDPAGQTGTVEALVRAGLLEPPHRGLPRAHGAPPAGLPPARRA